MPRKPCGRITSMTESRSFCKSNTHIGPAGVFHGAPLSIRRQSKGKYSPRTNDTFFHAEKPAWQGRRRNKTSRILHDMMRMDGWMDGGRKVRDVDGLVVQPLTIDGKNALKIGLRDSQFKWEERQGPAGRSVKPPSLHSCLARVCLCVCPRRFGDCPQALPGGHSGPHSEAANGQERPESPFLLPQSPRKSSEAGQAGL
jgi:hypothetical protein